MLAPAFVWASFLSLAVAYPSLHPRVMKQSRRAAPQGFSSLGAAPATQSMKLRFALASNDIPGLEKALLDVSTPSSLNYGKHLTKDEVNAYAAPSNESLAAVQAWLSSNNVTVDPVAEGAAGDWLTATVPVSKANDLLGASYETFQHIASGKAYARTLAYSLPASVAAHIDDVHPSTTFNNPVSVKSVLSVPQLNLKQGRGGGGGGGAGDNTTTAASCDTAVMPANNTVHASCANGITPTCLQNLYGIPTTAATQQSNSIAVAGFNEQFAQKADLKSFLTTFRKDMSSTTTFSIQTLDGGQDLQGAAHAGLEALDIQYTVGVATGVPVKFVSVGENFQDGELGGYLDIVNFLSAEDTIPEVMTTSYGENEADLSPALATKLCNAYMAMGARGTSILFASGDGGVEGGHGQQCTTFQVAFPAGCPYITTVGSVGGTNPETASAFPAVDSPMSSQCACFSAPDYQKAAVATYLTALGSTYKGRFNTSGRSYPDVSAQGENVQIIKAGKHAGADGTSCSSPIFASIIGLLNDQLIAGGKSPLGFLNPWLYANAEAFNDITTGSNSGDLQNSPTPGCGTKGFPAKAGWDPVTGLGTPNFAALKTAAGL